MDQREAVRARRNAVDLKAAIRVGLGLTVVVTDLYDRSLKRNSTVNAVDNAAGHAGHSALSSGGIRSQKGGKTRGR